MASTTPTDNSTELHPWVSQTQASLAKAKPGGIYGVLLYPGIGRLNVEVSKEAIPRSMLIWDRLLKTMESGGFKVRMEKEYPRRTIVTVDGEPLSIRLREKVSRCEHVPTPDEKETMERFNLTQIGPTWDYGPSGKLVLTIDYLNCYNQTTPEVTWTDSEKKRIEDRLDSVSDVLLKVAKDLKRGRVLWEERERIAKEEERRRQEAARLQAEEEKRCQRLEGQAAAWSLACSVRGFIHAVREEATRRNGAIQPGSPLDHWIHWAEQHVASFDPVATVLANAGGAKNGG